MDFACGSANSGGFPTIGRQNAVVLKEKAVFSGAKWGGIKATSA
jgi:hypothetical protein